ncbi:MAG: biotin/lipoyl-containing protein [Thermodesulfobacteriota bacterium]
MDEKIYKVTSPVMGTFYRAAAPGQPSLIEVGQKINASDIVCVIESMKIFTEIRSEHAGVVKEILVENEDPVMKKQELIIIERT